MNSSFARRIGLVIGLSLPGAIILIVLVFCAFYICINYERIQNFKLPEEEEEMRLRDLARRSDDNRNLCDRGASERLVRARGDSLSYGVASESLVCARSESSSDDLFVRQDELAV